MITVDQFYGLLRDAARMYPTASSPCLQLQAFRALSFEEALEVTSPTFGATICDKDKPYFWTRNWEASGFSESAIESQFPALIAFERTAHRTNAFNARTKTISEIEIAVVDRYDVQGCEAGKCGGCEGRTRMEIFRDTRVLLSWVLRYIGESVFAEIEGMGKGLFHLPTLEELFMRAEISGYVQISDFGAMLAGSNLDTNLFNVQFTAANIWGTAIISNTVTIDCEPSVPVVMLPGVVTSKACCQ